MTARRKLASALSALACLAAMLGCATGTPVEPERREQVRENLEVFQRELSRRDWASVERFFSPGYQTGYIELRNRIEDRMRSERLLQLQFIVNRVMQRDGLLNAQVRWNKSFIDKAGQPQKSSGISEFTLRPQGDSFSILNIRGDQFF